jgi:ATP-dependent Clp protease adaptor protein ClpS
MSDNDTNTVSETKPKTKRPRLYKVMLENDDFSPREFVVKVLRTVFRMTDDEAYLVMMAAHQQGNAVVSVYTRDIAESKANEACEMAKEAGHPLMFTIEPED